MLHLGSQLLCLSLSLPFFTPEDSRLIHLIPRAFHRGFLRLLLLGHALVPFSFSRLS